MIELHIVVNDGKHKTYWNKDKLYKNELAMLIFCLEQMKQEIMEECDSFETNIDIKKYGDDKNE